MDVSVIIVNYNTRELLKKCLNSIISNTRGVRYEIIVVDNMSSDGSIEMVEAEFPDVSLIKNQKNLGFGRANNIGIRGSSSKYVFLLNSDAFLRNNAIKVLFEFMEQPENNNVFCCGGALFGENGEAAISYGNMPSLLEVFFSVSRLYNLFPKYYLKNLSLAVICSQRTPFVVPYVSGADMFIRRSCLESVGAFDEDFFLYYEETELSFRQNKQGHSSIIVPEAEIFHLQGKSTPHSDFRKMALVEKSKLLYFRKCYGRIAVLLLRCILLLGYGVNFCVGFYKNNFRKGMLFCRL